MFRKMLFLLLLISTLVVAADKTSTPCSVVIEAPKPGANVTESGTVTGRITLPPGTTAWALARLKGQAGWWPQSGGPIEIVESAFDVYVAYGEDRDKGRPFEVAIVIVDSAANTTLNAWVERTNLTNHFPPVKFPNIHNGCPVATLTVYKQ